MRVSQSSGVECEKRGVRWFASIQGVQCAFYFLSIFRYFAAEDRLL